MPPCLQNMAACSWMRLSPLTLLYHCLEPRPISQIHGNKKNNWEDVHLALLCRRGRSLRGSGDAVGHRATDRHLNAQRKQKHDEDLACKRSCRAPSDGPQTGRPAYND